MASEDEDVESLSKFFQDGMDLYNIVDKTEEPTNSPEVQLRVKRAMTNFEKATRLASMAGLFSVNESIDEIATNDLQYMLLPALLGTLSLKLTTGNRKEILDCTEIYFLDFLQRCNDYGLSDYKFREKAASTSGNQKSQFDQLKNMVVTRATKIQRYTEQKELQKKLDSLQKNMANEHADEEIKRDYILTMIKQFIYKSIEEIDAIEMEKPMLVMMEKIKESDAPPKREYTRKPLAPVIITKDEAQKAVFGLGYPSLPTMTVKEFYDKRVADGVFPDPSKMAAHSSTKALSLQQSALMGIEQNDDTEQAEHESRLDSDDPDLLRSLRDKDEFKDDHRRGWGNRANRS